MIIKRRKEIKNIRKSLRKEDLIQKKGKKLKKRMRKMILVHVFLRTFMKKYK